MVVRFETRRVICEKTREKNGCAVENGKTSSNFRYERRRRHILARDPKDSQGCTNGCSPVNKFIGCSTVQDNITPS